MDKSIIISHGDIVILQEGTVKEEFVVIKNITDGFVLKNKKIPNKIGDSINLYIKESKLKELYG